MALTGLRRGEVTGLRWSDVDFAERTATIRHTRVVVDGRVIEQDDTKTEAGLRTIDLSDAAAGALLTWKLRQDQERENAAEAWVGGVHCFSMEYGRPIHPSYPTRQFNKLPEQVDGLLKITLHGLRHSYASLHAAAGSPIVVVSKLQGHSSSSITADLYTHMFRSIAKDAANSAADLIPRTSLTPEAVSTDASA